MHFTNTLAALLSLSSLGIATGPSHIVSPKNGTHIAPGATFNFNFDSLGDYCESSLYINVYIFTSKPKSFVPAATWVTGTFLGRYETSGEGEGSPPPSTLTMPDFSKGPGGFGSGKTASNQPVYLAVLEETGLCDPALGSHIALRYVTLIYNATTSS